MLHLFFETLYVTLASTRPGMPVELAGSWIENVIDVLVTLLTFHVLNDQLLVPLCSVFGPSFFSVWYVTLSMVNCPLPIRLTYRPGIALYTG